MQSIALEKAMQRILDDLAREKDAIMARWLEEAGRAASARGLDQPALANIMPLYLSALAAGEDGNAQVERHFATRLRQGFQLAEIVEEFALLARCIVEQAFKSHPDDRPDANAIDELYRRVQRASSSVVSMFDEHMRHDEQIQKRYARLLRDVAVKAIHASQPGLKAGMEELLHVVMDAMGAQSVALLLRNGEEHLVTVATAGAHPLEEYAATAGAGSFASRVAESPEPTTLWDVSSTELEVPLALRRSGIHAMLGVQLRSQSGLLGAIYIGIDETRRFAPREIRMLETLAEQLVAHIDAALLLGRLSATIATLRVEQSIREHFVAVLAHDLRGPLSAAKLSAEMLSREPESVDRRRELAVRIDRNLDRLDRILRDLLDANRIRAGERLPLRLDTCDLGQIAAEVVEELRVVHGDRFVIGSADRVRGVWSRDELRRALWNLGSNAVKYGAPGRPITFVVRSDADRAFASVHNDGNPIAEDTRARIFEPFARTSDSVRSGIEGWGLGLTLVSGVAEAHGGHVSMTSSESEGTTFTIEIPLDARPYQGATGAETTPATIH